MSTSRTEADKPPVAPEPPIPGECCERGCEFCVWVVYHEALRKYEKAYAEWDSGRGREAAASAD
jgi:hypothetical protein